MSYLKGVRTGAEGNNTLLKSYGGGSSAPRQGYATGGSVGSLNKDGPALSEGLAASGAPAKRSLARPGRKIGKGAGKKKDAKTNINVIVAPSAPKEAGPGPMPPMAGPPPGGPPMPPPGAGPGGPPMPMRAHGGRVGSDCKGLTKLKIGSKVKKRADGGEVSDDRKKANKERGDAVLHGATAAASLPTLSRFAPRPLRALGAASVGLNSYIAGRSHERANALDEKADKEGRKEGGPVGGLKNSQGGAGGGLGRLAKIRKYGK